jgi:hypothetical protein
MHQIGSVSRAPLAWGGSHYPTRRLFRTAFANCIRCKKAKVIPQRAELVQNDQLAWHDGMFSILESHELYSELAKLLLLSNFCPRLQISIFKVSIIVFNVFFRGFLLSFLSWAGIVALFSGLGTFSNQAKGKWELKCFSRYHGRNLLQNSTILKQLQKNGSFKKWMNTGQGQATARVSCWEQHGSRSTSI